MVMVTRTCAEPSCTGLTSGGHFCGKHVADNYRIRKQKQADAHRYNRTTRAWYGRAAWKSKLRPWKLMNDPLCEICGREAATDVHHKNGSWRETGNWALFMSRENLVSACHSCHSKITAKETINA
jgi:hypothetical protein